MVGIAAGAVVAFLSSVILTPLFAAGFRRLQLGQFYRADTPTAHVMKRGTPSMGGVVFLFCAVVGYLLAHLITGLPPTASGLLAVGLMLGMGLIGFLDDYLKVARNNSLGLSGVAKIIGCILVTAAFAVIAWLHRDENGRAPASTAVSITRDTTFDWVVLFGPVIGVALFIGWLVLIGTSVSNAVNLGDGLDGLAAGASILAGGAYVVICFWQYTQSCFNPTLAEANRIACYTTTDPLDLSVFAACLVGALIGFLWWNTPKAIIFMGDTGSFGIGGALAALAVLSRTELLLIVVAGLFLTLTAQVITQRIYFKLTRGKRIWRASPLHHHFEMVGWGEATIVIRFWIVAGICAASAITILYLEWLALVGRAV